MFYTIYQTTNLIDGKVYVGKHQTEDLNDSYLGSGKYLHRALKKRGIESFKKEILHVFGTETEMNCKEAELVSEEFCSRDDTYNICPGGKGGWGYVNKIVSKETRSNAGKIGGTTAQTTISVEERSRRSKLSFSSGARKLAVLDWSADWTGRKHTNETKFKIGLANTFKQKGASNSQFGSMWITDGVLNRKIKRDLDSIPEGWYKGRTLNKRRK